MYDGRLREGLRFTLADIVDTIREATVIITALVKGSRIPVGSGFFIAPGWVLSCAHVIEDAAGVGVEWGGVELTPTVVRLRPESPVEELDVALLRVDAVTPCVPTSGARPVITHGAWVLGITEKRITGVAEPYAVKMEITQVNDEAGLLRLTGDEVGRGLSGGPVLDLVTHEVCGIFKSERDTMGWAIPIDVALHALAEDLLNENLAARPFDLPALRERQKHIDNHVFAVADLLAGDESAMAQLSRAMPDRKPNLVARVHLAEWLARQLFELPAPDVRRLLGALITLPRRGPIILYYLVTCCYQTQDGSGPWISASTADALRDEISRPAPRAIRLAAAHDNSAEAVLRRAFLMEPPSPRAVGVVDSADPADIRDKVVATLASFVGADVHEWDDSRDAFRERLLQDRAFAVLGPRSAPDDALRRELATEFAGFPLMFRARSFTPADPDDPFVDLLPPIDLKLEQSFCFIPAQLIDDRGGRS